MSAQLEVFPITYQGNKAYFVAINQTRQRAFTGLWFASDKQLVLVWCGTVYKQAVDFLSSRAAEKPKGDKLSLADHSFVAPVHWSELAWILPNGSPKTQLVDIFQSKLPRGRACQSDIELLLWNPEVTKLSPDEVIKVGKSDLGIAHLIYRVLGPLPSGGEEFLALQNMQRWYGRWILGEKNAALVWCKLK